MSHDRDYSYLPSGPTIASPPPPSSSQQNASSYAARSAARYGSQPSSTTAPVASSTNTSHSMNYPSSTAQPSQQQNQHHYHHNYLQTASINDTETQSRLLSDILRRVQEHSYYMRRAMESNDLAVVLDKATKMLEELGGAEHTHHHHHGGAHHHQSQVHQMHSGHPSSSLLTSRSYYELYMKILDEMPNLEEYLLSQTMPKEKLYEIVQYCTRVVPRLYLQICAASVLLRSSSEDEHTTLCSDLLQTIKSIQCPIRGLFLRSYFLQALKDKLPADHGYDILLQNFVEMNSLWIRIQHMPGSEKTKEARKKRERERTDLRTLVGTNLVRLSQLDIPVSIYKDVILKKILEHLEKCNDALAQAYVMDCIIQAFPDEFHLETLEDLLGICPKLKEKVNLRTIFFAIMERFINYSTASSDAQSYKTDHDEQPRKAIPNNAFSLFESCISDTYKHRKAKKGNEMSFYRDMIRLQTCLLQFSIKCYPNRLSHITSCFQQCVLSLENADKQKVMNDNEVMADLEKFVCIPLENRSSTKIMTQILDLDYFSKLLRYLPWYNRKTVALVMVRSMSDHNNTSTSEDCFKLTDLHYIEELYAIITPLIRDPTVEEKGCPNEDADEDSNERLFTQEQNLVGKLVHLFQHEDTDELFKMYTIARKNYLNGGGKRVVFTIPPLVFAVLKALFRIYDAEFTPIIVNVDVEDKKEKGEDDKEDSKEEGKDDPDKEESAKPVDNDEENMKETEKQEEDLDANKDNEEVAKDNDLEQPSEEDNSNTELSSLSEQVKNISTSDKEETNVVSPENEVKPSSTEKEEESSKVASPLPKFDKKITTRKVFLFLQKLLHILSPHSPQQSFQLYLQLASTADQCATTTNANTSQFQAIAYEFMAQAFTLYEDQITDSKAQCAAITSMVGTLLTCHYFNKDDYDALITKTTQYAAKLLKKPDQCHMVTLCSHLFATTTSIGNEADTNQAHRVLECLQRSLKIADASITSSSNHIYLFVEILDQYVYYYENEHPAITVKFVSGLISLIKEHLDSAGSGSVAVGGNLGEAHGYFRQILSYIQSKKDDPNFKDRFEMIVC